MAATWIWAAIALLASWLWRKSKKSGGIALPPGPRGLPILGNLLMLGEKPHRDLCKLARKYGPVMYLRLGLVPAVVVSSPEAAKEVLKTHDLVFASRPPHEAAYHISYQQRNLSFASYGPYWRNIRKMCTLELLSAHKIEAFKGMRSEEVGLLVESIRSSSVGGNKAVDVTHKLHGTSADMSCRMVFGKKFGDDKAFQGFKDIIQQGMQLGALPNIGDFIPILAGLDLQGLTKRMKAVSKVFDTFLERIVDDHLQNPKTDGQTKDFVDVMLAFLGSDRESEYRIDRANVKAILLDMLVGSMDTSSTAIDWAMTELLRHPHLMNKVQAELQEVVGLDRTVEESDLENLHYLDMVIKETLRLHPVAPLLLPHLATEDCTVGGYLVPKNARVTVNIWAIGRDPKVWTDPDRFDPDRFEGSSVDLRGRDFQLIPFGSGRRGCPGLQLGLTVVRYVVAQLVHCFDWKLPEGVVASELDMSEEFGLTMPRAEHLMAVPTYRLKV